MATKRITEHHPFMKKVNELYDKMQELGLFISYNQMGGLKITDSESGQDYTFKDIESADAVQDFPNGFEFKLTFESED